MTLEPHIHCAECFRQILTEETDENGERVEVKVFGGTQFAVRPGPGGPQILPRPVPVCNDCHEKIERQESPTSKLIIPRIH